MAEGAVSFLLQEIESLLRRELGLNEKIKNGINSLKSELLAMNALLRDADARREHDHQVVNWVQQVQDLAYDIEHVLDMFEYSIAHQNAHWFPQIRTRHFISDLIDGIQSKLKVIGETKERYRNIIITQASSSSMTTGNYTNHHLRIAPLFMEDTDAVGIEESKDKMRYWALKGKETYKVMFVVGMGGSGKTTLVKKTFERVKQDFDSCAWITASKSSKKEDLLWSMFNQFSNPMVEQTPFRSSSAKEVDLMKKIRCSLEGKRYVLVLDDLWKENVWDSLSYALPNKCKRGRVIITTRRGDIAYAYSCRDNSTYIHNMQPLPLKHAQKLFYSKAFSTNGRCPPHLEVWAGNLLKICEGLPLGIIEIGRYLSNKEKSESQWKMLHDCLESELARNGQMSNTMKVLFLSYSDLPYHLKYCFLYLSIFPQDYTVKRRRLIRLWIAEGFIKEQPGQQVEDIGEKYLKELIDRSMVQETQLDFDGRPRSIRVHNLMHKIILSKSRNENFFTVCTESSEPVNDKTRRISIQKCSGFNTNHKNSTCRTLFMFDPHQSKPNINFSSLKLMKVLHLEGTAFDAFPDEITELVLLRYLCLSNTSISEIPRSIGKLMHLETLDLKQTFVTKLPKEVTKLNKLRHLLVCYYNFGSVSKFDCVTGFEIPAEVGTVRTLQKLSFLKLKKHRNHEIIYAVGKLTQLRKLGIIDLRQEDGRNLCSTIQILENLKSLNVTAHKEECLYLDELSNPPLLHRLYLKGRLQRLPLWIARLHDLIRIRLKWSKLSGQNNPLPILQDLPNLLELQLLDAYTGPQLDFFAGKFPKLKIFELEQMEQLRMVIMDRGALPSLQKIIIRRCSRLVQVPVGIDNLTHVKELILCDMPRDFVNQLRKGGARRNLVNLIPTIHNYYAHSNEQMELENLS